MLPSLKVLREIVRSNNTIHAIPTLYRGTQFRSKTEARCAVLLDSLGIRWQYEPCMFTLPDGGYRPDFWLIEPRQWLEIKGPQPPSSAFTAAALVAGMSGYLVTLSWGLLTATVTPAGEWFDKGGGLRSYLSQIGFKQL